jgi:hypothetical protein
MVLEMPDSMGFSFIPVLGSTLGVGVDKQRPMGELIAPAFDLAIEMLLHQDSKTGAPLDLTPLFDAQQFENDIGVTWLRRFGTASPLGKMLLSPVARPSKAIWEMYQLYGAWGFKEAQLDLALRMRVSRNFWVLAKFLDEVTKTKTPSVGNWIPGATEYAVDPLQNAARQQQQALEKGRKSGYSQANK